MHSIIRSTFPTPPQLLMTMQDFHVHAADTNVILGSFDNMNSTINGGTQVGMAVAACLCSGMRRKSRQNS